MAKSAAIPSITEARAKADTRDKAQAIVLGRQKAKEAEEFILERINTAARLEAFLNKLDFEALVKLEDGIKTIKDRKRREAEEARKAAEEAEKAAQAIRELAAKHGLDVDVKGVSSPKKKKASGADPEKYAVTFQDTGETYYWSGFGRSPRPFKYAMDKGYKKDELLKAANFKIAKTPKGGF